MAPRGCFVGIEVYQARKLLGHITVKAENYLEIVKRSSGRYMRCNYLFEATEY